MGLHYKCQISEDIDNRLKNLLNTVLGNGNYRAVLGPAGDKYFFNGNTGDNNFIGFILESIIILDIAGDQRYKIDSEGIIRDSKENIIEKQ